MSKSEDEFLETTGLQTDEKRLTEVLVDEQYKKRKPVGETNGQTKQATQIIGRQPNKTVDEQTESENEDQNEIKKEAET